MYRYKLFGNISSHTLPFSTGHNDRIFIHYLTSLYNIPLLTSSAFSFPTNLVTMA